MVGAALCLAALVLVALTWLWGRPGGATSTDNAYVRGDVTSLAPKVGGYVTSVAVQDNQKVEVGDLLFRIDDADYRARLAQANANVEAAHAKLRNIEAERDLQNALIRQAQAQRRSTSADLDLAVKANERRHALIRGGVVSQAQVDESDAARLRAEAGASAATAGVAAQLQRIAVLDTQEQAAIAAIAQAQAARELAKIDLESTVVRAPVAGVVGNRQVRVGRLVAPGAPLLDIVPVHAVWVVANFKETQVARIRPGARAQIKVDGYPGETFAGVVDSFAPGSGASFSLLPADNATGNYVRVVQRVPVKIRFVDPHPSQRLVPGLSARVVIDPVRG